MRPFQLVIALVSAASISSGALGQTAAPRAAAQSASVPRASFIAKMDEEFKKMDADKNGILSRKEIEAFQRAVSIVATQKRNQAIFAALDKDRNGMLTATEFGGLPMNMPAPNAAPVLAQTDGNRDGQVTSIEYRAGKLVNFDRMDTNKDGTITAPEMRAAGVIK